MSTFFFGVQGCFGYASMSGVPSFCFDECFGVCGEEGGEDGSTTGSLFKEWHSRRRRACKLKLRYRSRKYLRYRFVCLVSGMSGTHSNKLDMPQKLSQGYRFGFLRCC